jgi:hypothetical protein
MPKTVEDLLAESEIKDLHLRFCRANDRLDADLMRSLFHPDATIDLHKTYSVEDFIAFGKVILANYTVTWHTTPNQLVEVDGDVAWAENYTISSHRFPPESEGGERDMIAFGRYIDRVERRDGEWRFARRSMLVDYTRTDPVVPSGPMGYGTPTGSRDLSDLSYKLRLRG